MPIDVISRYLREVEGLLVGGQATEHTYRPALKALLESFAHGIAATNEPRRVRCGSPDFVITRAQTPLGYVEAKDVGVNLDDAERTEQLRRYLDGLGNFILTDYLEFRWYEGGESRMAARLARVATKGNLRKEPDGPEQLAKLMDHFFSSAMPCLGGPKDLAGRMAALARLLRDVIRGAFDDEDKGGALHGQMEGFRKVLLHDLEVNQFADMYAQTISYGLFAARCNHRGPEPFARERAAFELPETNPFLAEMFAHIAGPRLDRRLTWIVDHLAELLNRADIGRILETFGKRTRREDPVVHFYETFLAAYDPKMREARGVYYTPEPLVSYIVRSVDHLLKKEFRLPDGLADASKVPIYRTEQDARGKPHRARTGECHRVLILDPAAGTGTFLHGVIDQIHDHVQSKGQGGLWPGYVSSHLLPRVFGFELLMAPYAIAHMKLGLQLAETGYDFKSGERLRLYLTNTLEEAHPFSGLDLFATLIAEEANAAGKVKSEAPVMVVLGNPPYSGHSENVGQWIADLLRGRDTLTGKPTSSYFEVNGQPLRERNPKWLNDDYVKFIRFAQWRIEQTGYGILAFVTNHGYLENPTFRGMRQSLLQTFDDLYVLDLHGNAKKRETAPDGSKDENVFDIQQGVAVGIFVKRANGKKKTAAIRHAHLYGLREIRRRDARDDSQLVGGKYHWLYEHDVRNTRWKTVKPRPPSYVFVPRIAGLDNEYEQGWAVTRILPVNSLGIATARDKLTVHWNEDAIWRTVRDFAALPPEQARDRYGLGPDAQDWQVALAQQDLKKSGPRKAAVVSILYRPFDRRYTYYTGRSRGFHCRPRSDVMRHVVGRKNVALSTTRSIEIGAGFEHVFCSSDIIQLHTVSLKEVNYLFPLYLYPDGDFPETLFDCADGRRPNLASDFIAELSRRLKMAFVPDGQGNLRKTFGPEDVFHYLYALLHSPAYRRRYAQSLKADFPRVPLTSRPALFRALCPLGEKLTALHLLKADVQLITQFRIPGSDRVEDVFYSNGCVWVNQTQCFEMVPTEVWEFCIGGYQVCCKWLKDRKGRTLTFDEITRYQRIVAALAATIRLMADIDRTVARNGGWPIQ